MIETVQPRVLAHTESVCPVCLARLPAQRIADGNNVYQVKTCPQHGSFRTVIWRGLESYSAWGAVPHAPAHPPVCETQPARGCPFDCGLCPEHRQHSCCVLLEVTQRCNLRCPVCFASAVAQDEDPDLGEIEQWLKLLRAHGKPVNVQLSGGEPTVRDDLPEIVALTRSLGFDFIQLNTNGIRLAKDRAYARRLAQAGLDCVFLQFDGVSNETYRKIRGADLYAIKQAAIECCRELELGVVLVPTLVPGVNVNEIGSVIDFAVRNAPAVRAVHFQPVSYFGRYPNAPQDSDRITLPEVMVEIEQQTGGAVRVADFTPGSAENAYCSFNGSFYADADGKLHVARQPGGESGCGCGTPIPKSPAQSNCCAGEEAQRARRIVAGQWVHPSPETGEACCSGVNVSSLDAFLAERRRSLSISGMAFQDAWNLDLERLRECFIHIVSPDRRVIPFCAYNLTSQSGVSLYRNSPAMQTATSP